MYKLSQDVTSLWLETVEHLKWYLGLLKYVQTKIYKVGRFMRDFIWPFHSFLYDGFSAEAFSIYK